MTVSQGTNHKFIRTNGREFRIIWEVFTLSAPEGARVIVVDMGRPAGKKTIFDEVGAEHELDALRAGGEAVVIVEAGSK
jgi:hypothetical protein